MKSLLFIEDDDSFRITVARALQRRGWELLEAPGREAAVSALRRGIQPEGILLDMRLGSADGKALIPVLRKACPRSRLVVLTGYGNVPEAMEALRLGADDYLLKPAGIEAIVGALHGIISAADSRKAQEQPPSLARVEWEHIQRILHDCGGNISQAARLLGIDRRTLQRKLAKLPPGT